MKLNSWDAPEYKALYRLIRTSDYAEIKGEIITADDVTGECTVQREGETKTREFGPGGLRIIERKSWERW